jgi:hypothetical protein
MRNAAKCCPKMRINWLFESQGPGEADRDEPFAGLSRLVLELANPVSSKLRMR